MTLQLPAQFEEILQETLRSEVEFIDLIGGELSAAGGKRLRPQLVLLAHSALGHRHNEDGGTALRLAVCVELLHTASLLHDDLIDAAETRRGQAAAWSRYGNVVSVMSGDFMLARLLCHLADLPRAPQLVRAFGETAAAICEGEVLQFQTAAYGDYSEARYFSIIRGKTAVLTALATRSAALLTGASSAQAAALEEFGEKLGLAFQIRDDLLDLFGDEASLGKPAGGDLREGKATLPLLKLQNGPFWPELEAILTRRASSSGDTERVREICRTGGGKAAAEATLEALVDEATAALEALPPSAARSQLAEAANKLRGEV